MIGKREMVLDTEATGLCHKTNRMIEIGIVEIVDLEPTGNFFHSYFFSGQGIPSRIEKLTGITYDFLKGKPLFKDVYCDIMNFIGDCDIVAHKSDFDMRLLNKEIGFCNRPQIKSERFVDTLEIAKEVFPMESVSLDSLMVKFGIDSKLRETHSAINDAKILTQIYKFMKI